MQREKLWLHVLLSFVAVSLPGCGGSDTVSCGGLVTLDGKPLAGAAVAFIPADGRRPATGKTDEQGRFTLTTFKVDDGALPGEHAVTVTAIVPLITKSGSGTGGGGGGDELEVIVDIEDESSQSEIEWLAPEKYSHRETSGLSATVGGGQDFFEFKLESE